MGREGDVVSLRHSGDQTELRDSPGVANIWLNNRRRFLIENVPKTPFGENSLARGDRQMRLRGDGGHAFDILALDRLFDKERLIRLDRFDQQHGRLRLNDTVEVEGDVDIGAESLARVGKALGRTLHVARAFDVLVSPAVVSS